MAKDEWEHDTIEDDDDGPDSKRKQISKASQKAKEKPEEKKGPKTFARQDAKEADGHEKEPWLRVDNPNIWVGDE